MFVFSLSLVCSPLIDDASVREDRVPFFISLNPRARAKSAVTVNRNFVSTARALMTASAIAVFDSIVMTGRQSLKNSMR